MSKYEHDILSTVNLRGTVSVSELAQILDVSDQTIRRIVKPLVERGELRKVHGALVSTQSVMDPPFLARMQREPRRQGRYRQQRRGADPGRRFTDHRHRLDLCLRGAGP